MSQGNSKRRVVLWTFFLSLGMLVLFWASLLAFFL